MTIEFRECNHRILNQSKFEITENMLPTQEEYLSAYKEPQDRSRMVLTEICKECSEKLDEIEKDRT